jgi:hypothetical protein
MEDTEVKENEAKEKEKEWWSSKDSLGSLNDKEEM